MWTKQIFHFGKCNCTAASFRPHTIPSHHIHTFSFDAESIFFISFFFVCVLLSWSVCLFVWYLVVFYFRCLEFSLLFCHFLVKYIIIINRYTHVIRLLLLSSLGVLFDCLPTYGSDAYKFTKQLKLLELLFFFHCNVSWAISYRVNRIELNQNKCSGTWKKWSNLASRRSIQLKPGEIQKTTKWNKYW